MEEWSKRLAGRSVPAILRTLDRSVVVKRELSQKGRLSVYQSIFVLTFTYGHDLWVMTERIRLSFLRCVAGLSLRDRVRSSVIQARLRVELL